MKPSTILSVRNITRSYPGVKALDDVSIDFQAGEVHALVGENGAGKSTLIKVLTGAIEPDSGEIEIAGRRHESFTPHEALFDLGIGAIYQEFNLVPFLSVTENVFFGKEIQRCGFLDSRQMTAETAKVLETLGVEIDPGALVKDLSVAYQQIVEIAKTVSKNVKILIMDEPTAPLTTNETEHLFRLVGTLKDSGVTIIYISHKMSEIIELADRITVLRDGKFITTLDADKTNRQELIGLMVGGTLSESYPDKTAVSGDVLLEVKNLNTPGFLKDISFALRKGEILGFGGLVGAGRTELAEAIFGASPIESGEIFIDGDRVRIASPAQAIARGVGLIPEDRKRYGILAEMSVRENVSYSSLKGFCRMGIIDGRKETEVASSYTDRLRIKTPDLEQKVKNLSGGNQQKVVLSKWLATQCRVLLFDEPTRGIDVGAKQEIYELIRQLADDGKAIMLISSEIPELIGLSDRILVMREGQIVGTLEKGHATQEAIVDLAVGQ
jgi:ribose transport system ATP-binding protein